MSDYKELKVALTELDSVLNKHSEAFDYANIKDQYPTKTLLSMIGVAEDFNVSLRENTRVSQGVETKVLASTNTQIVFDNNRRIIKVKEGGISWSDDGSQPCKDGEWLYYINFPTGAYFFHSEYPTNLFNEFFTELKGFDPEYCDTANKCLYFDKDKAHLVHEKYDSILKKYREKVAPYIKQCRADKLREELKKLEG